MTLEEGRIRCVTARLTASSTARRSIASAMFGNMCGGADQARADHHHAAEGEGPASGGREARHARQARRPACAPPGDRARSATSPWSRSCSTCSGPRYKDRNGGYTRVLKAGFRHGDNAAGRRDRVRRSRRSCQRSLGSGPVQERKVDEDATAGGVIRHVGFANGKGGFGRLFLACHGVERSFACAAGQRDLSAR